MSVRYAAKSDVGRVRSGNEDSYLVQEPLFVVADGMGGHLAGDVASRMAVDVLMHDLDTRSDNDREALVNAVKHANSVIFEESQSNTDLSGMGTTCTLMFVSGDEGRIAHVGDSRAYLLREGKLSQLTDDHTLVNRMVKEGRLRPEEADRHPQRSIITRALGVDANVKVDYKTLDLKKGDRILLCSDGLTSMIDTQALHEVLAGTSDPDAVTERLVELANEAGGDDNITVVLIDVDETGDRSAAPSAVAAREPVRRDEPSATHESARAAPQPRRWLRRLVIWVVALAVLAAGGFFVVDYLLDRSWYIGANEDGFVVVYQGIPEEVLGLDLKDEARTTGFTVEDLPEHLRDDVRDGIKVSSQEEAQDKVEDLRARVRTAPTGTDQQQNGGQQDRDSG